MQSITKIVLTGGPCGGKSTALSKIEQVYTAMGYKVIFVSETATELIAGGVTPRSVQAVDFQSALLSMQVFREKKYEELACKLTADKVLLVCDRGALDNKAYMSAAEYAEVLSVLQMNEIELRDGYDAVFHLVSAADGAPQFYTTANNAARTETLAQARVLDQAIIAAWTGHPHLRVLDNSTGFEEKMTRLIREISHFLGEPQPFEIERKFLIQKPDTEMLERLPNCQKVDIIQTYLETADSETELRIRQRGCDGHYIYIQTEKRKISDVKRVEVEKRLRKSEYLSLLMNADTTLRQIRKTRYCLLFENQYFEIDIYPFWENQAIVEIELTGESDSIVFPDFLRIIKEVTEDARYKNRALAESILMESEK